MQPRPRLLIATRSPGKLQEFVWLLRGFEVDLLTLGDLGIDVQFEETADTAAGNAIGKARAACHHASLPTLADDSALEIPALGNAPGVAVRRWQGLLPDDIDDRSWLDFFVRQVEHLPTEARQATFRTAVALAAPRSGGDPDVQVAECTSPFEIRLPPREPVVPGMPLNSVRYLPERGGYYNDLPEEVRLEVHRGVLRADLTTMIERVLGAR